MLELNTPIEKLNKVGDQLASRLQLLNIFTVEDLLYHFPFRYEDFSEIKDISSLKPDETVLTRGKLELLATKRSPRKKMLITEAFLTDQTGSIKLVWFRQPYIVKSLNNGDEVFISGKVRGDLFHLEFHNPNFEKISLEGTPTKIQPVYSTTKNISQKQFRFLIKQSLEALLTVSDHLPREIKEKYQLAELPDALKNIHFPETAEQLARAEKRLKFDELISIHLNQLLIKKDIEEYRANPLIFNEKKTKEIVNQLDFDLTDAQRKSAWQILLDMAKDRPMNRLLEGDVGSGKTVVAGLAVASAALNDFQTVVMAPTEILAYQDFLALKEILKPLKINMALVSRSKKEVCNTADKKLSSLPRAKLLKTIESGEIDLVVGTHALLSDKLNFKNLGLVIIDEQQRFGVEQRRAIREKSGNQETMPHLLSISATPIPRSLALTIYGNLDLSIIDQLPPGRKKPITKLVDPVNRDKAYDFILTRIKEGRQAYVICPLIDESDKLGVKAVTDEYEKLNEKIFPQLKVGLLHGKLKPVEKDKVMKEFSSGRLNILVSTTVVEVGVNVPNASVMIIESAERFGLSQLHQLRGRVNRAEHQSYCFLFAETGSQKTLQRLQSLVNCYDGFKLAEEDLQQRGFGSLTGVEQAGFVDELKLASLTDVKLIQETKETALEIMESYPEILNNFNLTNFHPE